MPRCNPFVVFDANAVEHRKSLKQKSMLKIVYQNGHYSYLFVAAVFIDISCSK